MRENLKETYENVNQTRVRSRKRKDGVEQEVEVIVRNLKNIMNLLLRETVDAARRENTKEDPQVIKHPNFHFQQMRVFLL